MAELGPVNQELVKAGYRRPSLSEYVEAGYKAETYVPYFEQFEREALAEGFEFDTSHLSADTEPPTVEFGQEPIKHKRGTRKVSKQGTTTTTTVPKTPKPRKPSFTYPGFYEPD